MQEEWRDIKGFEGYYQISNLGRVRSLDREIYHPYNKTISHYKGSIMRFSIRRKGYLGICLTKGNKQKSFLIHRLVAQAFIPNPMNYDQINHIDENKANNRVDNLEWCDCKYNVNYGSCIKNMKKTRINNTYNQKKIMCVETGVTYFNSKHAERETGYNARSIRAVCEGKYKSLHGLHWMFIENIPEDNGDMDKDRIEREKYGKSIYTG